MYHTHSIRSMQFVYAGTRAKPVTGTPAPVNSGVIVESLYDGSGDHHHGPVHGSSLSLSSSATSTSVSSAGAGSAGSAVSSVSGAAAVGGDGSMKEGTVSVHGVTPVHTYSRLISIAADGRMAVHDVYTGACRMLTRGGGSPGTG